ncbi:hypothetical protein PVAND_002384 [Polypedilum vanderplanki]|uniref:ATP synthase subunit d, mitochondrial n=1 Tax=Polypedilum vanderplanki TaxID=319348 RepID=A0A9J6BR69_POLVA|nr:hypothetical protein PVAND_002384 [Polypedilum vanderplanki]
MASRRIAASSINWAAIAERVPAAQRTNFTAFKSKSDKYLRSVLANPENPPKIDWAAYKNSVPIPGMVENFQKQYEALKVPYPSDNVSSQLDQQKQQVAKEIEEFKRDSSARIAEHEKAVAHLKSLLPYAAMTMEDFNDAFPDQALDAINRPTFWPHDAAEQEPRKEPEEHH